MPFVHHMKVATEKIACIHAGCRRSRITIDDAEIAPSTPVRHHTFLVSLTDFAWVFYQVKRPGEDRMFANERITRVMLVE
jgi:hypothetical protein